MSFVALVIGGLVLMALLGIVSLALLRVPKDDNTCLHCRAPAVVDIVNYPGYKDGPYCARHNPAARGGLPGWEKSDRA